MNIREIADGEIITEPGAYRITRQAFWSRHKHRFEIVSESGCWIWGGAVAPNGYGKVKGPDCARSPWQAHRAFFWLFKGKVIEGQCVCHACDVPCCVNPSHLFSGTCAENMQDMAKKLRNNTSRLTVDQVLAIRRRVNAGAVKKRLAIEFGVSPSTISAIANKENWGYL